MAKFKLSELFGKKPAHHLGITFSGGAARGYAHVGVLKALEEHGVAPQIISGTSMGAVVGALYAAGYSPLEIEEILIKESAYKVMGFAWRRTGLLKLNKFEEVLKNYLPDNEISHFKKPLYIGVTNLNNATHELRSTGTVYNYLTASCSVPGVFAPVLIENISYADGGLMCNLPALAIRDKCRYLIGSHVNFAGKKEDLTSPKVILERAVNLGITQNAKPQMKYCDFLLEPQEMQQFSLFDFSKIKEIIEVGYAHTIKMIENGELPVERLRR